MIKDNFNYLNHILTSISRIQEYTRDKEFSDMVSNHMILDAVIRQIEIIGEATGKISNDFKVKYNDVPWMDMKGMRNKLIHDYFNVNIRHVWNVVSQDIPELKVMLEKIFDENNIQIKLGFE